MEIPSRGTAASAPGKVLLAGGYLVLDRAYTGLVFGLDARIHVVVEPLQTSEGVTLSEIIVRSPQFRAAEWRYSYRKVEDEGGVEVVQLKGSAMSPSTHGYTASYDRCDIYIPALCLPCCSLPLLINTCAILHGLFTRVNFSAENVF